jgi:hypothetical protein
MCFIAAAGKTQAKPYLTNTHHEHIRPGRSERLLVAIRRVDDCPQQIIEPRRDTVQQPEEQQPGPSRDL